MMDPDLDEAAPFASDGLGGHQSREHLGGGPGEPPADPFVSAPDVMIMLIRHY